MGHATIVTIQDCEHFKVKCIFTNSALWAGGLVRSVPRP